MDISEDYLSTNKALWNKRTAVHVTSDFYDVPGFLSGNTSLKEIELALLGKVTQQDILHLQCHFGQDTLSLARMGAKVTGIDLSDAAIHQANEFTKQLQLENSARFICCDLYSAPAHVSGTFDRVFTSYALLAGYRTWINGPP